MTNLCPAESDVLSVGGVSDALTRSFISADSSLAAQPRMAVSSKIKASPKHDQTENKKVEHSFVTIDNSGATACLCLVGTTHLVTANIGDSRAVLAVLQGSEVAAVDLSHDHKPNDEMEVARIKSAGCRCVLLLLARDTLPVFLIHYWCRCCLY